MLLDPKNITISTAGMSAAGLSYFELVDPNADSGAFLTSTRFPAETWWPRTSSTTSPPPTPGRCISSTVPLGRYISTITGSTASDQVGTGVSGNSNGNYVIRTHFWDNGATVNAGTVTWSNDMVAPELCPPSIHSTAAQPATPWVSTASRGNSNGNYVVLSAAWDNGGTANVGAATWCSGAAGCTGEVAAANSLMAARPTTCSP